jgi:hypothetical protein
MLREDTNVGFSEHIHVSGRHLPNEQAVWDQFLPDCARIRFGLDENRWEVAWLGSILLTGNSVVSAE